MKRLLIPAFALLCLLTMAALAPQAPYAADAGATEKFSTLNYTADETVTGGTLEIAPESGNTGVISVVNSETATVRVTIGSVISGDGMNLRKTGDGILALTGTNTYTGNTEVLGGRLNVGSDANLGAGSGTVTVNGGSFRATSTFSTDREFIIGSDIGYLEVANTSTLTINGKVTGTGVIQRASGTGVIVLTNGNNDFSGGMLLGLGTTRLTHAGAAGTGAIRVYEDATLELAMDSGTMSNRVFGEGAVIREGSGTLTMTGSYLQAGTVEVKSGTLAVNNSFQSPSVTVASGATLNVGVLFLGATQMTLTNEGTFNYNSLEVIGKGNTFTGDLPSAAGKTLVFELEGDAANGDTMLSITGNALNVTGSTVSLLAGAELANLKTGNTITLIDKTTGRIAGLGDQITTEYGATTYTFSTAQGDETTAADAETALTVTYLGSTMTGGRSGPAKAYLESAIAGLHTSATAGRFVANRGIEEAVKATGGREAGRTGLAASAAFQGAYEKVDTGSNIEGGNYNIMGALTYRFDHQYGVSRVGIFAEGGWGDWDTKNSTSRRSIKGDSDIDYAGGGVLLRHDLPVGIYGEATFRVGRVSNDFSSGDMGTGASYDVDATYWGAHLGLGYIYSFTETDALDIFGKVFWTRQESESVTTDAHERLKIDSSDSIVSQLGARYERVLPYDLTAHVGAAWEHEYDGEQTGTLDGRKINSPDMGGSSAVGDLGLRYQPGDSGFSVDLTGHGSLGTRDSVGGSLSLVYEF